MHAGSELRIAREKRGLSRDELSARTRISAAVLEAMEEAQYERLPAAVYLRGFLRCYAEEAGVTGTPIVQRYLAEYEKASRALTAFDSEATVLETVVPVRPPEGLGAAAFDSETELETPPEPPPAAAPPRAHTGRAVARIVALAASLVIVAASAFAVRSLGTAAQPVTLAAMPAAQPMPPPEPVEAAPAVAPAAAVTVVSSRNAAGTLSGEWTLTNEVQSTSYKAFEGLQLAYRLTLAQDGAIVTGRGEKWMENGREIPSSGRTPISVAGTLHQGRLELSFTERGTRRSSAGRFSWQVSDDGELRGTFLSDAASSRGSSYARRRP